MPLLSRLREIAVEIEAVKGTAEASIDLTGADSKILVYDLNFDPDFEFFERDPLRSSLAPLKGILGKNLVRITFRIEVRRTGTGTTEDQWFKLLKACGLKVSSPAGGGLQFLGASDPDDQKTLTMWVFDDGLRKGVRGAMGNVRFSGNIGEPKFAEFDFIGSYIGEAADALNTVVHETAIPTVFQGIDFRVNFLNLANTKCISSLTLDMGNEVSPVECANDATGVSYHIITNRGISVEIDPEQELIAVEDWLKHYEDEDTAALTWKIGTTIFFNVPFWQINDFGEGDRNGILILTLSGMANGSGIAGDDDFILGFNTVAPAADFTDPAGGASPYTAAFTDTATGDIVAYRWDFDDGETAAGNFESDPSHIYVTPGTFNPTQTVIGPGGYSIHLGADIVVS